MTEKKKRTKMPSGSRVVKIWVDDLSEKQYEGLKKALAELRIEVELWKKTSFGGLKFQRKFEDGVIEPTEMEKEYVRMADLDKLKADILNAINDTKRQ